LKYTRAQKQRSNRRPKNSSLCEALQAKPTATLPFYVPCYTGALRRLIINADDFGLTLGVNRAIVEAHTNGVVTSATMMANAATFNNALHLTQSTPTLGVGCHIVLVDGKPLLPPDQIPDLVEPGTPHFHRSLSTFIGLALRNLIHPDQIEAEATAQIRKLQTAGIQVSHLDTHKHTHMFPQVLHPLLRAARACGVSAVRNPFEPVRVSLLKQSPRIFKRWLEVKALRTLVDKFLRATKQAGISTPAGTLGIAATGILDEKLFNLIVSHIPEGTWEFVCHPGYNDADLQEVQTRLRESRAQELRILTSANIRQALGKRGIELVSYRVLA